MQKGITSFGDLFRKFRLKAGFTTLSEFGKALADGGLVFEDSLFSRWQKGSRVPKNRNTLLTILEVLIKKEGITSLKEVNLFLESAGQGYLTDSEIEALPKNFLPQAPFQVPSEIAHFTGREKYIEKIEQEILNRRIVLIHGPAGIGKTVLAIKIGHLLRHAFPDGVLWYRLDTSNPMSILSSIARTFGENVNEIKDVEIRASVVRSILSSKKLLLILDNAEQDSRIFLLLPNSQSCATIITSRYQNLQIPVFYSSIFLKPFTPKESLSIFKRILGIRYIERNKSRLLEISNMLGNLPLAVSIFAKQIAQPSKNIRTIIAELQKEKVKLEILTYEDRNFYISINSSFRVLKRGTRKIFVSLGIFDGKDFSSEVVSSINNLQAMETKEILEDLLSQSLIERSTTNRYRLHPLVKLFAQEKLSQKLYLKAAEYYEKFLKKGGRGNSKFYLRIEVELDNIIPIFNKCYELKYWEAVIRLWEYIGVFLWDTGNWDLVDELGQKVYKACIKSKNDYARALCCIRELSWLYYWKGKLEIAFKWAEKGLKIASKLNDDYLMAYAKQRLGKIYQSKQWDAKAKSLLKQSMNLFTKLKELERLGDTLTYMGEHYILIGNLEKGEQYFKKALRLTKEINDINQNSIVLGHLGEVNYIKKNYNKARECFEKSLSIANIRGMNVGGKVWCNIGLALLAYMLGNYKESYRLLQVVQENMLRLGIWYDDSRPLIIEYKRVLSRIHRIPS